MMHHKPHICLIDTEPKSYQSSVVSDRADTQVSIPVVAHTTLTFPSSQDSWRSSFALSSISAW